MLEVGWSEILVIALVLIIVVGPKDLPPMLRAFGRMATRLRGMANEFKGQFDEALREADLDDVRKGLSEVNKLNPANTLRDAMNPIRKLSEDIKSDLKKASDISTPATSGVAADENKPDETIGETTPTAEPLVAPLADAVTPLAIEKIAEPAPIAQPLVYPTAETPIAKPKATRKKAVAPDTVAEAALASTPAEPVTKKAPVRTKAAAVAAVAAETAAKKPVTRKKPAATEFAPDMATGEDLKPRKPAPRKKAEKAGDA